MLSSASGVAGAIRHIHDNERRDHARQQFVWGQNGS
jgi:hypothetical protein